MFVLKNDIYFIKKIGTKLKITKLKIGTKIENREKIENWEEIENHEKIENWEKMKMVKEGKNRSVESQCDACA